MDDEIALNLNLGPVNFATLTTDADIRREAKRVLPNAIEQLAESAAVVAWEVFVSQLGDLLEIDPSAKAEFIAENAAEFVANLGAAERAQLEESIAGQIRSNRDADT